MPVRGQGSGFIVSADGIVLTSAHVVEDAQQVVVKLTDRREFVAKVLGSDPSTDIAVLKIDAMRLPTVQPGRPQDLKVGEWVLAIGSPYGLENSVSAGVVSATGRSLPDASFVPFIQTDAAVNPGSSGGPLFNARGDVVGINSQIYSRSGGYQGLSFAVPIDVAQRVQAQIVATGGVQHARLGVTTQEVDAGLAESFGLAKPAGALVSSVEPDGPADRAGLKPGDVILKANGTSIVDSGDLSVLIGMAKPGDKLGLDVWRRGESRSVVARLGAAATELAGRQGCGGVRAGTPGPGAAAARCGRETRIRRRQRARRRGRQRRGRTGRPAARRHAARGERCARRQVEQVRQAAAKAGKSIALLVQRGDARIFVPVRARMYRPCLSKPFRPER